MVGNSNVGKTSLLDKLLNDRISTTFSTIGVECRTFVIKGMENIKVRFWDTAGEERFNAVSRVYYRGVDCAIVCYSEKDEESRGKVSVWVDAIRKEHEHVSRKKRKEIQQNLYCKGRTYVELPAEEEEEEGYGIPIILAVTKCDGGKRGDTGGKRGDTGGKCGDTGGKCGDTGGKRGDTYEKASLLARELHIQGPVFTSAINMSKAELETIFKPFFRVVHRQVLPCIQHRTAPVELSKPNPQSSWNCCKII